MSISPCLQTSSSDSRDCRACTWRAEGFPLFHFPLSCYLLLARFFWFIPGVFAFHGHTGMSSGLLCSAAVYSLSTCFPLLFCIRTSIMRPAAS